MASSVYLAELEKALTRADIPPFSAGASGYFDPPSDHLDPSLFDANEQVDTVVRHFLISTLYQYWKKKGYKKPEAWSTVWLAGSGISYQWAGNRGNGDLDVLMGIDWPTFYQYNPSWNWQPPEAMATYMDNELRSELWPRTARTNIGGKTFEVTYFINQAVTDDLRVIHPYAAYSLTRDQWDVRPPRVPHDPNAPIPHDWDRLAALDSMTAHQHALGIQVLLKRLPTQGSPQWINAMNVVESDAKAASELLDEIHHGRQAAFQPNGHGYNDAHNYRWQAAKKYGLVAVLGAIQRARKQATEATQTELYGAPLATADELITRAALRHVDMR